MYYNFFDKGNETDFAIIINLLVCCNHALMYNLKIYNLKFITNDF